MGEGRDKQRFPRYQGGRGVKEGKCDDYIIKYLFLIDLHENCVPGMMNKELNHIMVQKKTYRITPTRAFLKQFLKKRGTDVVVFTPGKTPTYRKVYFNIKFKRLL